MLFRKKRNGNSSCPSPIFFPEDSTSIDSELAGLLARLAFCGLPKAPLNLPKGEKLTPKRKEAKASVA